MQPAALERLIQEDIYSQQKSVQELLQNKELMLHIWQNRLSESEFNLLSGQRFIIHLFDGGKLVFWNSNEIPVTEFRYFPIISTLKEGKNISLYQSFGKEGFPTKRMNIIIPVYKNYEVNNEYLKSGFLASSGIPETSEISYSKTKGATLIQSIDRKPLFFVTVKADEIKPIKPSITLIILVFAALITTILSTHLYGIYLCRKFNSLAGIGFVFLVITGIRLLVYFFGLPFQFANLQVFSPQVFASDNFLPSFGHLFFHVICIYWFFAFLTSKSSKFEQINFRSGNSKLNWFFFVLTAFFIFEFAYYLQYLVQSIVFDSDISFDTNTFNATDKFTFLSLVVIAIIARILLLSLRVGNEIFNKIVPKTKYNFSVLILVLTILLFIQMLVLPYYKPWTPSNDTKKWLDVAAVVWMLTYLYLIDNPSFKKLFPNSGLFTLIFLSVYFSLFFSVCFKFYIDEKEQHINRTAFTQKLSRHEDTELEMKFETIEKRITQDTILQKWMAETDTISIQDIYKHFKLFNPDIFFPRYAQDMFLFNPYGQPFIKEASLSMDSLLVLKRNSTATISPSLFFRIENSEQGAYLVYLPIIKSGSKRVLGYLFVNFKLKQNISQSLYPRLLNSTSELSSKKDLRYNYAIYINEKLANQFGNYNFHYNLKPVLAAQPIAYTRNGNYSELYFKTAPNMVYIVVYQNNIIVGIITIFSFLFGMFLIITSFENWVSIFIAAWISGKKIKMIYNASMSVRVKYFALGFTAISFFIIGLSTVYFLTNRYQLTSLNTIEQNAGNVSEAINEFIQNQKSIMSDDDGLGEQITNTEFAYFLTNIAQQQKMDINIFDVDGKLAFTTQENIYKANILDMNMSAKAFYNLTQKKLFTYVQPEAIGRLNYTASYSNIINHEGKLVGYLNIPSFYTKQNLDNQIVSLITTLVNIYTILLLISSVITFLFINSLTKSLRLVAESLRNVNLKKNELINWPYKDEIGLLVNEYNKMVATVEKNARSLVLDERQNAWREMAQQVAHEIKNPLTPMKLNIQYLQQAINSNHPDIINLTKRVSSSIIEQIDNLNYIASEFSNFAKMPESKTERIDLKNMLERIVPLFSGNGNLTLTYSFPEIPIVVFADRSQMLRIFTNIVQNAVESLSDEQQGIVDIQLVYAPGDEAVIIKVKDNGSGIPESVQDKIFEPYFTTKSSGTGLGLAMTKKIIELWGGSIRFESSAGNGTTFFLSVPVG